MVTNLIRENPTTRKGEASHSSHCRSKNTTVACLVIGLITAQGAALFAQNPGNVSVAPTRVVFEGRTRSAQIALINQGKAAQTYRISFTQMRMTEDGRFEEIDPQESSPAFADRLIRYAPRQVTLEPGIAQTVRLLLRKPADLAPGEYRSHLLLRAVPPEDTGTNIESLELDEGAVGVQLIPIFGISIPVIVRHGDLSADVAVTDLAFQAATEADENPTVSFRLERSGERSVYGDVTVTLTPENGGSETVVQQVKGLAVYTPNPSRTVRLALHPPEGVDLRDGRLKVTFAERPETPGAVTAEGEIPVS